MSAYRPNNQPFVRRLLKLSPASMVILSFVLLILVGTLLLKLPIATNNGIGLMDALFTATSAVCVTGLIVVDTGGLFTLFGQSVILLLIQIGGLGVMTISVMLFLIVGRSISFRQRMAMQEIFSHSPREDILQVVRTILIFTLIVESAGTVVLFSQWAGEYPLGRAFYLALFHSISAFCNAGFSLFEDSLVRYSSDWGINISMGALVILGGIGFPVVYDIATRIKTRRQRRSRLAIQTKTVLLTTGLLILIGAGVFLALELSHTLAGKPLDEAVLIALFQSITCRTAGFNTIDISILNNATLMMMSTLMFFGASPGSAGGGVKTTTLALIIAFTWSRVRRQKRVNLFKRSIPVDTVSRSISLTLVCISLIGTVLFFMLAAPSVHTPGAGGQRFLSYLFESVSAFGTVGLSMGVTAALSDFSKVLTILLMLVGRAGVLAFSYITVGGGVVNGVEHAEENIMIG